MIEMDTFGEEEEDQESPGGAFFRLLLVTLCAIGIVYFFVPLGSIRQGTQDTSHGEQGKSNAYVSEARSDALAVGISPALFVRQIDKESGFDPNATSPSGAQGIAQLMPDTANGLGVDPWDPIASLSAAAHLMARYSHTYSGDYAKALAAYNGGPGAVENAVNTCGEVAWIHCLPGETQNYVQAIMNV